MWHCRNARGCLRRHGGAGGSLGPTAPPQAGARVLWAYGPQNAAGQSPNLGSGDPECQSQSPACRVGGMTTVLLREREAQVSKTGTDVLPPKATAATGHGRQACHTSVPAQIPRPGPGPKSHMGA